MDEETLKKLDDEEKERLDPIVYRFMEGDPIDSDEVFKHRGTRQALSVSRSMVPSFDLHQTLVSLPFYDRVLVLMCPYCAESDDCHALEPLLDSGAIVPMLLGTYAEYPPSFVSTVLRYPHISGQEFHVWRYAGVISEADGQLCHHCVEKHVDETQEIMKAQGLGAAEERLVDGIVKCLHPYVHPDYTLLEEIRRSIEGGDAHRLDQLKNVSQVIAALRTSQAYEVTHQIPLEILEDPAADTPGASSLPFGVQDAQKLAMEGLGLTMPSGLSVDKYCEIVMERRAEIRAIVDHLMESEEEDRDASVAQLMDKLSELDETIRGFEKGPRAEVYRAVVGFTRGNKALVASLLVAAALGLGGNLLGCGVSVGSGALYNAFHKSRRTTPSTDVQAVERRIHNVVEPVIDTVMQKYTNLQAPAFQVWKLRRELKQR